MTVSESDPQLQREVYELADVDERDGSVRCPLCGRRFGAEAIHTPTIPPSLLEDATLDILARAYTCERHRVDVVALEPASVAPEGFVGVPAVVDDREVSIAVPEPVADREGLA